LKVLGITGGVGAGKSTILEYLKERYGARIILADDVGRLLQEPGRECFRRIVEAFGEGVLREDGALDRGKLAAVVFADEELLRRLNAIVHPAVKAYIIEEIARERAQGEVSLVVIEAALLLEDHYDEICDEIWYIHTDCEVRKKRLMASRGYSEEKVAAIMGNQLPDVEYRSRCDRTIDNSSDRAEDTWAQIDRELKAAGFSR
jgi:dephospho-CoA kinase